jgi:Gpi18-like mannosyltransferase
MTVIEPRLSSGAVDDRVTSARSTVIVAFAVSRVVAIVTVVAAYCIRSRRFTFQGLALMDGGWYHFIAELWYGPQPLGMGRQTTWPFFPLLPGIGHLGVWLHVDSRVVMVLVSNGAFLLALVGVRRLVAETHGPTVARWTVWVTALFPAAFVFSMAYPDALFLMASVWAFVMLNERRYGSAGALAAIAALCRPNGILVVVALAVGLLAQRPVSLRRLSMTVAPAVVAVAAWCAWLWYRAGDPLIFWRAKSAWHEVTLVDALVHHQAHALPHLACAGVVVVALWLERRGIPLAWHVFAALWLLPPLFFTVVGSGRYANECFPAMVAIAMVVSRFPRRWTTACLAVSGGGMVLFSVLVARFGYVP